MDTPTGRSGPADRDGQGALLDEEVFTEGPNYNVPPSKTRIRWYRCPLAPGELSKLNRRSNILGFAQTLGHLAIAGGAIASGWWIVVLVFTFPNMFGAWLQNLCNAAQHIGLQDNVPDFRLCCRTIYLNPVLQFLYWHMNYHTEHHMYAAVPCYRLGRLHRLIEHEMPPCPNVLRETWRQITAIQQRQEREPDYQYIAPLPSPSASA